MSNRKKAEEFIFTYLNKLDSSGYNTERYKEIFANMSDKDFHEYMTNMRNGESTLVIFAPLLKTKAITTENNLKLAKEYGVPMFERLRFSGGEDPDHVTEQEFMLLDLGIRRQSQSLVKKISVPDDNRVVDQMTGQPTGDSKGSSLSQPELGVLVSLKLNNSIEELFRFRGGDKGGFRAYNASIEQLGSVSLKSIAPYVTGVESTKAVKNFLTSIHLKLKD